ncbi:hypothetical protein [Streptomyces griseus]|uniref:hypothetical protein n=1 Tax=Streptomyces griseus TaxID=1911 RepID=UPI001ABFCE2B|nr:hypothetical protein [Streptomyces fimicarius]
MTVTELQPTGPQGTVHVRIGTFRTAYHPDLTCLALNSRPETYRGQEALTEAEAQARGLTRCRKCSPRPAQPAEDFTHRPLYDVPNDYQQAARPFTVAVAGPGRAEGDPVELFLVEDYNSARAWAKVLAWYMVENETPDAIVVGSESFDGAPDKAHGFVHDLRGEYARQEALDDLADQAAEQVDAFRESTEDLADHSEAYETALTEAAYSAWPLVLQVAANDGS